MDPSILNQWVPPTWPIRISWCFLYGNSKSNESTQKSMCYGKWLSHRPLKGWVDICHLISSLWTLITSCNVCIFFVRQPACFQLGLIDWSRAVMAAGSSVCSDGFRMFHQPCPTGIKISETQTWVIQEMWVRPFKKLSWSQDVIAFGLLQIGTCLFSLFSPSHMLLSIALSCIYEDNKKVYVLGYVLTLNYIPIWTDFICSSWPAGKSLFYATVAKYTFLHVEYTG